MNDKQDNGGLKAILILIALYAAYRIVEAVVAAVTALLMGLVNITLGAAGVFAVYWLYRYITDQRYGETKNIREIEKMERQRKAAKARLPKHLRHEADSYFRDKQAKRYDLKTYSRGQVFAEKARDFFGRKV
jgi:hypothetical protein